MKWVIVLVVCSVLSRVQFFVNPLAEAYLPPLSMEFSRQEHWSGLPFPPPWNLPHSRTEPASLASPALQADSLPRSHGGSLDPAACKTKSTSGLCSFESQYYFLSLKVQFSSVQSLSRVRLFLTPRTVTHQAPLSTGLSRQEYWSGFPCPPPGGLPDPGIKPVSPALQADSLPLSH